MRFKKALCFLICIFSLCLSFPQGKKDKKSPGQRDGVSGEEEYTNNLSGTTEDEFLLEGGETEAERDLTLKDFVSMHKSDFVSAMDYYNQLKELIKKTDCYPVTAVSTKEKELFILAIVFPEMMRYSAFRDEIETRVTSVMYSCGSDSLICSIGYIQMKPTFASQVERNVLRYPDLAERYNMFPDAGKDDTYTQRHDRIVRLKTKDYQIQYLCAFIDLAMKKFKLSGKDVKYQLKILSTAYNAGYSYSLKDLEEIACVKAFPNGTKANGSLWNYSDLVIQFYDYVTNGFCFD